MTPTTIGPLRVRSFGGTPIERRGGGDGPAILLCHGFGAPGDDLCSLARVIDAGAGVRWFFPEAPIAIDFGLGMPGRAWWPIDMVRLQQAIMRGDRRSLMDETPPELASARAALEACIDALERDHGVARERLIIGGFSQGGMLTTEVALFASRPFAGLAVMSGTLLSQARWREAARASGPSLHALLSHGRADPLLPFEGASALRQMLEGAGARVEWVPHNGQHEIPMAVIERLGAFAKARFEEAKP
jgi:phospholipase/carboxylesterase